MKIWKRNAIVATVLVMLCAGVYINWSYNQREAVDLTQTLNAEQVMSQSVLEQMDEVLDASNKEDSFAQIRLSRQESRDSAVELLQQTMSYEDDGEQTALATASLDHIVSSALAESQIESLIVAKGFADCVAYMGSEGVSVAVAVPEGGLQQEDVALIADIVMTQSEYTLSDIRIVEVQ